MSEDESRELSTVEHWDSRYAGTHPEGLEAHEWFRTFDDLRPFLTKYLPQPEAKPRILHLGCGLSNLTKELYDMGYDRQVNVDFSTVAIEEMRKKCLDMQGIEWQVMDVRQMAFPDAAFDIGFDKGTLDAMLWGSLWNPEDEVKYNVESYVNELKYRERWLDASNLVADGSMSRFDSHIFYDPYFEEKKSGMRLWRHWPVKMARSNTLAG